MWNVGGLHGAEFGLLHHRIRGFHVCRRRVPVGLGHLDHALEIRALHVRGADPVLPGSYFLVAPRQLVLRRVLLLEQVPLRQRALHLRVGDPALGLGDLEPRLGVGLVRPGARQRVLRAALLDTCVVHRLHLRVIEPAQPGIVHLLHRFRAARASQCKRACWKGPDQLTHGRPSGNF